ncbi:hypothetical protein PPYR_05300 [Photinus pyralis]|uniref:Uncharacterized protein n=2 Tax=Photinus pyralis TaxID=7054 RepID=A0A5N4AUF6_PHOPY|nr:G1/S-specific cyclin-E isoform X2 [Photinus pyralis]KAB0800946.1 hypothetical protein PPYR_05300 [Photinus pyralis]
MAEDGSSGASTSKVQPSSSKRNFDQNTPHSEKHSIYPTGRKRSRMSESGDSWTPSEIRATPLPLLRWADSKDVWQMMVYREEATKHNRICRLFEDPTNFLPRMRAILIDWIMEVCEAYHLTRTTFYLAVDYIDRYLTVNPAVPKNQLQLIGITALFIAAKFEEIYPPKLSEFSYVCDGACSCEDIVQCEISILSALEWDLNFMTPTGWLNLYMQIHCLNENTGKDPNFNFMFPQYSPFAFVRASNLLDLFTLDPNYLLFSYSVIAAAAVYFIYGRTVALKVSGYQWKHIKCCVHFLSVHYKVLADLQDPRLESVVHYSVDSRQLALLEALQAAVPNLTADGYTIQSHLVTMTNFEDSVVFRVQLMGFSIRKFYVPVPASPNEEGGTSPGRDDSIEDEVPTDDEDLNPDEPEANPDENEAGNQEQVKIESEQTNDGDQEQQPTRLALMFEVKNIALPNQEDSCEEYFTDDKKYNFDELLYEIYLYTKRQIAKADSVS